MAPELDDFHLPDDLPTPSTTGRSIDSREKEALRPAPLNFSRPRPARPTSQDIPISPAPSSGLDKRFSNISIQQPYVANRKAERSREEDDDDAAPPPVVRRSSFSPSRHPQLQKTGFGNGSTWIFKPYAGSVSTRRSSDASSAMTYETDTTATDEASSIAESAVTDHSSISDFAFDGRLGWNPRNLSQAERERQRWTGPVKKDGSTSSGSQATTMGGNSTLPNSAHGEPSHTSSGRSLLPQRSRDSQKSNQTSSSNETTQSATSLPIPPKIPRITKRTSWDQFSERVNFDDGDGMSDTTSTHSTEWKSSEFDTSGLSVAEIHKLKKKGINPALYAEMKQARKGGGKKRNLIGPLTGGTFLG